jgi:uncharacterized protein YgiM (DUF1202 family)
MSKNYNKKDISVPKKTEMEQAVEEVTEKAMEETGELEKAAEPIADEMVSASTTAAPALGVVTGCDNLRVRKESSTNSTVITTLPKKTVVKILSDATPGWYYIQETETKGFVMSKFIEIQ